MRADLQEIKEYLSQAYKASREIDYLTQELLRLEELMTTIQAVNYSERVQSSSSKDLIDTIHKIDDAKQKINTKISEYLIVIDDIKSSIDKCENIDIRYILRKRYVLYQKWSEIAEEMKYSTQRVFQLHGKGLEEIYKIIKD